MPLTRRTFAGLFAMGSRALASTGEFFEHKVLRRPYVWQSRLITKPGYQWRSLTLHIQHKQPVRVIVRNPDIPESLVEVTVPPTPSLGPYGVQSVRGFDAGLGLTVRIESKTPFQFERGDAAFMIHAARIKEWTNIHGHSLGAESDMGPTFVTEELKA